MSSRFENLPDSWAAISATRAYWSLTQQPFQSGLWLAIRRPLFVAFVLACSVTLIAAEPFNPGLLASTTAYWTFVPLAEALALIVVCWSSHRSVSLSRSIDLFFTGHAPWLLWFAAVSIIWSFQSPHRASSFTYTHLVPLLAGSAAVIVWSCYIDFCFFRIVLARTRTRSILDLAFQRLISWALILVTFAWASLWSGIAQRHGP